MIRNQTTGGNHGPLHPPRNSVVAMADTVKIGTRFVRREFNASRARLEMKIAQEAGRLRHNPRLKPALDFFEKIGEAMEASKGKTV
mgnify:CR=1 FL=1